MLALAGVSDTDVNVFAGGPTFDGPPPHPVVAMIANKERREAAIEPNDLERKALMCSCIPILVGRRVSVQMFLQGCSRCASDEVCQESQSEE